jgi:hypothetical protein
MSEEKARNMPLTEKGKKVLASMKNQSGSKKGEEVFYASINAGKLRGAEASKRKRKH